MNYQTHKIGIWGLGVAGTSLVRFFSAHGAQINVFDQRTLTPEEHQFLADHAAQLITDQEQFFSHNTHIVPSAGIDITPYLQAGPTFISELDLFAQQWHKPIIAVTGSVGKTSVTHLLNQILSKCGIALATGGNIGIGMLDLIEQQDTAEYALLELSSFQLEHAQLFAPTLALWTNLKPNHLDRHGSMDYYFLAKSNLYAHQTAAQTTLLPLELLPMLAQHSRPNRPLSFFCTRTPSLDELNQLRTPDTLFFVEQNTLIKQIGSTQTALLDLTTLPPLTFTANWVIIACALELLGIQATTLISLAPQLNVPEHRLEYVTTIHDVIFYNDSKSTTIASTLAALEQLSSRPTHLFLGGLGKGINRAPLIKQLPAHVKAVYCFGKEAEQLHSYCVEAHKQSGCYATLEQAFAACTANLSANDCVLFSPSGASFDLFTNYQERGTHFKKLVNNFKTF